jgi:hypothetical protein
MAAHPCAAYLPEKPPAHAGGFAIRPFYLAGAKNLLIIFTIERFVGIVRDYEQALSGSPCLRAAAPRRFVFGAARQNMPQFAALVLAPGSLDIP